MDNVMCLHQTVYAAYAPHKLIIDKAVHDAAMATLLKLGTSCFSAAFCKTQLDQAGLAA